MPTPARNSPQASYAACNKSHTDRLVVVKSITFVAKLLNFRSPAFSSGLLHYESHTKAQHLATPILIVTSLEGRSAFTFLGPPLRSFRRHGRVLFDNNSSHNDFDDKETIKPGDQVLQGATPKRTTDGTWQYCLPAVREGHPAALSTRNA